MRYRDRFVPFSVSRVIQPPVLSENAEWLLAQRYFSLRYDETIASVRRESSFHEFARRVSRIVASAESLYLDADDPASLEWLRTLEANMYADLCMRRFLFNSPCLFGAGAGLTIQPEMAARIYGDPETLTFADYALLQRSKTKNQQLFACFVISVGDSIEGIFDSVKDAAVISKFGGGVGGNFGNLRERGSEINGGVGGKASGPISFMETWNTMGAVVVQGGRRRAALMGMLYDDHPDILDFIRSKEEEGRFPYFNISVCLSDALIRAAGAGEEFALRSRKDGSVVRTIPAAELMTAICESAWKRGDPGVFFIDRANADNLLKMGPEWRIESTNPCGEQPLPNYTSCNLGSVNADAFVGSGFDAAAFENQVFRSMYYLDLVIDACSYPLPRIEDRTKRIRPVGLGIMGLADAAIRLRLRYGADDFLAFCDRLASLMSSAALQATVDMVDEMGKSSFPESGLVRELFGAWRTDGGTERIPEEIRTETLAGLVRAMRGGDRIPYTLVNAVEALARRSPEDAVRVVRALFEGQLRNSRRLSIAPTGSISMLIDASPGVEPNFAWSWSRRIVRTDASGAETREFWHRLLTPDQREELRRSGRVADPVFVTAYDIGTEEHVSVVGRFAAHIDSGISKTVNLPNEATVEDVRGVYEMCYRFGAKGITIYRDGSRNDQPVDVKGKQEAAGAKREEQVPHTSRVKERPGMIVFGKTIKEHTPWGSVYVTLNFDGDEPFEVFASIGKSGSELKAMTEALSRAISIGLRSGGKLEDFIATLKGLSGKEAWLFDSDEEQVARSIPDAVALLLEKLIRRETVHGSEDRGKKCPECDSPMEMVSGCAYCFSCGYSPCK